MYQTLKVKDSELLLDWIDDDTGFGVDTEIVAKRGMVLLFSVVVVFVHPFCSSSVVFNM